MFTKYLNHALILSIIVVVSQNAEHSTKEDLGTVNVLWYSTIGKIYMYWMTWVKFHGDANEYLLLNEVAVEGRNRAMGALSVRRPQPHTPTHKENREREPSI